MLTRRIAAAGATALTLALPALAAASPIHDPATAAQTPVAYGGAAVANTGVVYGDTQYNQQNAKDLGVPARVDRIGSLTPAQLAAAYGTTKPAAKSYADQVSSLAPEQLAAAYGTAMPKSIPMPATTTVASNNDGTDGWEIAAIGGAALLAAAGLGGAYMVRARRRTVEA